VIEYERLPYHRFGESKFGVLVRVCDAFRICKKVRLLEENRQIPVLDQSPIDGRFNRVLVNVIVFKHANSELILAERLAMPEKRQMLTCR
jgi:hypothetical protein